MDTLLRAGSPFQKLLLKDEQNPQKTACAPLLKSLFGDRHMPLLADKPLRSKVGKVDRPAGKSGLRVAFFPGCMGDKIYTGVSEACLKVFEHHGVGCSCPSKSLPAAASPRWCPATARASKR